MQITRQDLAPLMRGAEILGSGGGGSADPFLALAEYQLQNHGAVTILTLADLQENHLVVPLAFVGAPSIALEKWPNGLECEAVIKTIQKKFVGRELVLMPAEIGGANALTPFLVAARLGLPVLDADLLGRAFPKVSMASAALAGVSVSPAFIGDALGNTVILHCKNAEELEQQARQEVISMGSSAAIAVYLMNADRARNACIPGSISLALSLGRQLLELATDSEKALSAILAIRQGHIVMQGEVCELQQTVQQGFIQGFFRVVNIDSSARMDFQNEYLQLKAHDQILAATPDIILVLEQTSCLPIGIESLRKGLQVVILALRAADIWYTQQGLAIVGLAAFPFLEQIND
jgi:DUF917 family protein